MDLQIRNYQDRDINDILDLFLDTYNVEMTKEYWTWRYDANLIKEKYIKLMWDEQSLAGHYAVFPIELKVGSAIKKTGFSMTTMTSSKYRKLGIFNKLAKSLYDEAYNNLELIWGFPNNNSVHGFKKYLGWEILMDIPMFEISTEDLKINRANSDISNINIFSKEYDYFFNKVCNKYDIVVKKNSEYLNWRYINNPSNKYYVIECREAGEIKGFCVYKLYVNDGMLNGYIVDILASSNGVFDNLIRKAIENLSKMNSKNIYIWMNDEEFLTKLKEIGFCKTNRITHFGCKKNNDNGFDIDIYNYNNWYLMMGDSDVF